MRRFFTLGLTLTVASVLLASPTVAGASTKFAYSEAIDDTGNLVVSFEEGSQKRFDTVEYQLDATATATWTSLAVLYQTTAITTSAPDGKGRVTATLATTLDLNSPPGGPCGCGLQRVEYSDVTLTNRTTGHVYHLDSIARDFP